jgi:hypothetical protein
VNVLRTSSKEEIEGVGFILQHFSHSEFPRKISTSQSNNTQIPVISKKELISKFNSSNYVDCSIAAFPYLKENISWASDLIFIDLDKSDFMNEHSFKRAYNSTMKNIRNILNGNPTVLFTGGGYHIYQPIEGVILDNFEQFRHFGNPFNKFLRFAKDFLSNGKADKNNFPSLNSCLLRVPHSINSKYNTKVQIIKE